MGAIIVDDSSRDEQAGALALRGMSAVMRRGQLSASGHRRSVSDQFVSLRPPKFPRSTAARLVDSTRVEAVLKLRGHYILQAPTSTGSR